MNATEDLSHHFDAGLAQLAFEIEAYPDEGLLWHVLPGTTNTAGNLCLHLCGNLQHYLGAVLGHSGYVRRREAEFAKKHVPRTALLNEISRTRKVVREVLQQINDWDAPYPEDSFGESCTIKWVLWRLLGHLWYHLGQINYHRRIANAA